MSETVTEGKQIFRVPWLDTARGIAVIAMVIYHFTWDLSHFGFVETDIGLDRSWKLFAQAIAAGFLAISGFALAMTFRRGFVPRAFLRRLALVGGAAAAITLATWFAFPDRFIFFGILHCIAAASVVALAFRSAPAALTGLAALASFAMPFALRAEVFNTPALIWLGLGTKAPLSNDFVPLFPWLGWLLAGLALGRIWRGQGRAAVSSGGLARLGRWSLPVYLIHQPLLFALFMAAGQAGLVTLQPEVKEFVQSCAVDCETSGGAEAVCLKACACVARTLRDRPVWPRVTGDKVTTEDQAELAMVGRRCFDAAQSTGKMPVLP